jgi:hypothetical protein
MLTRVSKVLMFMFLGVGGQVAWGQSLDTLVSLNNEGSTTLHAVTVAPGGTFTADLNLVAHGAPIISMRLLANAEDIFSVGAFTYHPPFNESGWYTEAPAGGLNPASAVFGIKAPDLQSIGPGEFTAATATIGVSPAAPAGTYALNFSDIWIRHPLVLEGTPGVAGPDFAVTITPEPVSAMFLGSLLLVGLRSRSIGWGTRRP